MKSNNTRIQDLPLIHRNVLVEKIVPGGDGLARVEGKVFFIPFVLESEIVDLEITHKGKKFSRARVLEIKKASPQRQKPICSYYGICGGCNFQHIPYDHQIALKRSFVIEHFRKHASLELPDDFLFIPSPSEGYRSRVQFQKGQGRFGFMRKASREVIPIDSCPILEAPLNDFLKKKETPLQEREIFFADSHHYWRESSNDQVSFRLNDRPLVFSAKSFFQSNLKILPELLDYVLDGQKGNHALDLYSGAGLFSVFLRDHFSAITAVEINPDSEASYSSNMDGFSYQYFSMSLEQWLKGGSTPGDIDFIITDPPRTGLSEEVRRFLLDVKVPRLVYVSCDPVTQARDCRALIEGGYVMEGIRGFDFYPHTHHMESVVRMRYSK